MGTLTINRKIIKYIVLLLLSFGGLVGCIIYANERERDSYVYHEARVLVADAIYRANQGEYSLLSDFTYTILSLTGEVLFSNDSEYTVGSKLPIKALSGTSLGRTKDSKITLSFPYIREEQQVGTIYVTVEESLVTKKYSGIYWLVGGLAIAIVCILVQIFLFVKRDILMPMNQLHVATKSILNGELSKRVSYDYDGEIGTLCHDFEAMRADLEFMAENEQRLKEKEKLLLAYISHDLRTPIAIISGYVEGIHNHIVSGDRVQEYTTIILSKIQMLNALIDDILEHSKAQLHEFEIVQKESYAKDYFEPMMKEFKSDVTEKGLAFVWEEIPNVLLAIDSKRIYQVMQNLVGNSIKFTKQGSIQVKFQVEEHKLLVGVLDTGMGIVPSDLPFVCQPFYRGEKARTLNVTGSGLGLSISKYIIEKHGGRIEVDSVQNSYTFVQFSLPTLFL